jgi:hypothetical protein
MKNQNNFLEKYLKYKTKYLELKKTLEGGKCYPSRCNFKKHKYDMFSKVCKNCGC